MVLQFRTSRGVLLSRNVYPLSPQHTGIRDFHFYHQQYLSKNPGGYRGLGGRLPFQLEIEQLHIDMVDDIEAQRQEALGLLARWPELVCSLEI